MPWQLDYGTEREPEALAEFLSISGRALYVATSFESKCRYLLQLARFVRAIEETDGTWDATQQLMAQLKRKLLDGTIKELRTFSELQDSDLDVFVRAKDARNFICHDLCDIGPVSSASTNTMDGAISELRKKLPDLIAADNVVSSWLYEVQERQNAPRSIRTQYPKWLERWILTGSRTSMDDDRGDSP